MIKVLIADDEVLVRVGIKSTIDWEKHGFTIVGEARNGEEALEKIEQLHPDVLLTDIRMPKMDGIELIRRLEERHIRIYSVIMSCYNDFELVRSAMKYGASDYLLKLTLTEEELLAVLERLKQKISIGKKQQDPAAVVDLQKQELHLKQMIRRSEASLQELNTVADALNLGFHFPDFTFLLLSLDYIFDPNELTYREISESSYLAAENLISSYLERNGNARFISLDKGEMLILLPSDTDPKPLFTAINGQLKDYLNISASAGVTDGNDCCEGEVFTLAKVTEVFESMRYHQGPGILHTLRCKNTFCSTSSAIWSSLGDSLIEIRGIADFPKLPGAIRTLCEQMSQQCLTKSACQQLLAEVFYGLGALFQKYGGDINGINDMFGKNFAKLLSQLHYLRDTEAWFASYTVYATKYCQSCCNQRMRGDILAAVLYIQEHFDQPISANTVARKVGISNAYFSTIFKQETSYSFTEYLTDLRIEKAKKAAGG